ncbi:HNH endonuclease [Kutzneria albida]|uniref:HNH endonuclease n=1 Tax=Kutzneria albida TaxID=43357 RepID=UPI003B833DAB
MCGLCNEHIDYTLSWPNPGSPSLDHIVPLSRGGSHTYENVQAAHLGCNVRAQDKRRSFHGEAGSCA